jgi:hypothetical protein
VAAVQGTPAETSANLVEPAGRSPLCRLRFTPVAVAAPLTLTQASRFERTIAPSSAATRLMVPPPVTALERVLKVP